jgi:thiamine biosynthesis lipoprotein
MKLFLVILTVIVLFSSCSPSNKATARTIFVMDTFATITVYNNPQAIDAAFEKLFELEKIFSYTDPDSELSRINSTAYNNPVEVSRYMGELIETGLQFSELTGGAFDISLGKLIDGQIDIDTQLCDLGYENIIYSIFQGNTVQFANESIKMHFGSIVKGFAVDKVREILIEHGVESAIIDIGGEVGVVGLSPRKNSPGGSWRVGINDPFNPGQVIRTLNITKGTLATSATYERGEHIFDPITGLPADSGYASVTVIADSGMFADAVSTAVFVRSAQLIESWEGWFCVVTVCNDGQITSYHFNSGNSCHCSGLADGTSFD